MSLSFERHDRDSRQSDHQSQTIARPPLRITAKLPDGSQMIPIEIGAEDELVLVIDELGGQRDAADRALATATAAAAGDMAASMDAFRATERLHAHLAGPQHGLKEEEIPAAPERLHLILHPEGMRDHEVI